MKSIVHDINSALILSKILLGLRECGIEGEATIQQLRESIIPELIELQQIISDNNIPKSKEDRFLKCYWLAVRCWDWNLSRPSILLNKLNRINEKYKNISHR